jgi:hypothetical protein
MDGQDDRAPAATDPVDGGGWFACTNGPAPERRPLMSMVYLAQPEQQQQLEWLDGGTLAMLLDGTATDGQLMVGRFDVSRGEAPPYHRHTREDEVFLPKQVPHGYRITSAKADLLMINTPAGIEGMFRETGRDKATPRPPGFLVTPDPGIADKYGNIILGPPR